jgi:two-component system NtrC family sensor kinase
LANIINDPLLVSQAIDHATLRSFLEELQQTSDAFVDLGIVSEDGNLVEYVGPVNFPSSVSYQDEEWFRQLLASDRSSVITEVYLGFRGRPHFTIAVKRRDGGTVQILRSTLSPDRLANYLTTLEGASEVHAAVVNGTGVLQVTTPRAGEPLQGSFFIPPEDPVRGFVSGQTAAVDLDYAYAWLSETPWALVVTDADEPVNSGILGLPLNVFLSTVAFVVLGGIVILLRARQLTGKQIAVEQHEAELSGQLVQAAKLASVGELAAGIAHEINNPLAIIAEEVGVLKDSLDPTLADEDDEQLDLDEHLGIIHEAVFRCRDITRKLLTFVRHAEVKLDTHDVHGILDEVLDGILGNEISISNVEVVRRYDGRIPGIVTDRNQLIQVFVNLIKNALDAMPEGGALTVRTFDRDDRAAFSVADTGCGMTAEQVERVFMPFFTTKDPGKGTGLGLSVSYSIIKSLGGECYVESTPTKGSTFTVELPYEIT